MAKKKKLTDSQKQQFVALCDAYRGIAKNFAYVGYSKSCDATRNLYSSDLTTATRGGKFALNCATFAQLLLMGRSAEDFASTKQYSNKISKAFTWGYYFKYPMRRVYTAIAKQSAVSAATRKNASYPSNDDPSAPFYDPVTWTPASFALAGDMAFELWQMGCEIGYSELEVGDIVFLTERNAVDKGNLRMSFRNISHVAIVYGFSETADGIKHPIYIDSTADMVIGRCTTGAGFTVPAMALAAQYELRIVMCAKNPAALGFGGNVPDKIEEV